MMEQLAAEIYSWATPHPEWRTAAEWGHTVNSYALVCFDTVVLVDPLLPSSGDTGRDPLIDELDGLAEGSRALEIMVTIPYHTRSAEILYQRYAGSEPHPRLWGHKAVATRLQDPSTELNTYVPLEPIRDEERVVAVPYPIGNPRRYETPLWIPELRAIAFGDAVVGVEGTLRIWQPGPFSTAWYREKFLPTLRPLLELEAEHALVTHGPPVMHGAARALADAVAAPPWDHAASQ